MNKVAGKWRKYVLDYQVIKLNVGEGIEDLKKEAQG